MSEKFLLENFVLLTGKSLGILIFPMDWNVNEIYFHYMCSLSILPKSSWHYCSWCSELVSIRGCLMRVHNTLTAVVPYLTL